MADSSIKPTEAEYEGLEGSSLTSENTHKYPKIAKNIKKRYLLVHLE